MRRAPLLIAALALLLALGVFVGVQAGPAQAQCGSGKTEGTIDRSALAAPVGVDRCQGPPPDGPNGIFLCYSKFQTLPGVWLEEQAAELLAAGYWYPNAVAGNVPGGPNLGSNHLVCNAPGTATGNVLNENGSVVGSDVAGNSLGYYPLVSAGLTTHLRDG